MADRRDWSYLHDWELPDGTRIIPGDGPRLVRSCQEANVDIVDLKTCCPKRPKLPRESGHHTSISLYAEKCLDMSWRTLLSCGCRGLSKQWIKSMPAFCRWLEPLLHRVTSIIWFSTCRPSWSLFFPNICLSAHTRFVVVFRKRFRLRYANHIRQEIHPLNDSLRRKWSDCTRSAFIKMQHGLPERVFNFTKYSDEYSDNIPTTSWTVGMMNCMRPVFSNHTDHKVQSFCHALTVNLFQPLVLPSRHRGNCLEQSHMGSLTLKTKKVSSFPWPLE